MSEPTDAPQPPDQPKPADAHASDAPPQAKPPATLDITDEEWIAASQSCCGRHD